MPITIKSIDTMKASRDTASLTNQQKVDHINAIIQYNPDITHITIDCYTNNTGYQSYAYVQEWADAVHNAGKKIWWRPAFIGTDGSSTLEEIYTAIMEGPSANPGWFATGDIFELQAESNPYIGVLNGTAPDIASWNAWIRDKTTAAEAVFAGMGKTVDCKKWSLTDGYQRTPILESATITALGDTICVDFYPLDLKDPIKAAQNLRYELGRIKAANPTASSIIISEIGVTNTFSVSDTLQRDILRSALNELSNISYVSGINYWVGYKATGGGGFTELFQTDSLTSPRPALKTLGEYFKKGACTGRMAVI